MIYKLIAVVSKDGFIARYSGDLPVNWTSSEEQDFFKKDIKDCTWSVMGRVTHELSYNENKKRIIFPCHAEQKRPFMHSRLFFVHNMMAVNEL